MHKTDAAIRLISNAPAAGIKADYVLMDTWFTTEPMLREILDTGIDAIGMVKQLKQRYTYRGRQYTLPELKSLLVFPVREIFRLPRGHDKSGNSRQDHIRTQPQQEKRMPVYPEYGYNA